MSSSDHLLLILHIGFAIFTLGPLTAATMSAPRYIRKGDVPVLRFLTRTTRIYWLGTLGVFLFGLFLAKGHFAQVWLTASMTLFVVAFVLLIIVERDMRKAADLLDVAAAGAAAPEPAEGEGAPAASTASATAVKTGEDVAQVQRGRIAAISGVVALLWIVILVLMVWH
ncbi:hypothetical protein [Actinomadura parmotrematis]|uniref:DUF2269 family protein n=1 Tax=Actinomadura parmotrematis TaxID=2864039 RepID=A0ABS7FP49_9ACTN|nr:hypothetical protein [Actinomadura parmotrematis]MBW8481554.1 hypothetical protein [Actinomadura parmotrematis]